MELDELMRMVGDMPWFDLATLTQLSGGRRASIINQMYRLAKSGRVVPLRRGMYTLAEPYRKAAVQPAALANALYRPSYLSCEWALSYHGIIPEAVSVHTSVTTRAPRTFANAYGEFQYRNVKLGLFTGYGSVEMAGVPVRVATPEKALFDFFHLSTGEWSVARLAEMRIASIDALELDKLELEARQLGSPRVRRAVARLVRGCRTADGEGTEL